MGPPFLNDGQHDKCNDTLFPGSGQQSSPLLGCSGMESYMTPISQPTSPDLSEIDSIPQSPYPWFHQQNRNAGLGVPTTSPQANPPRSHSDWLSPTVDLDDMASEYSCNSPAFRDRQASYKSSPIAPSPWLSPALSLQQSQPPDIGRTPQLLPSGQQSRPHPAFVANYSLGFPNDSDGLDPTYGMMHELPSRAIPLAASPDGLCVGNPTCMPAAPDGCSLDSQESLGHQAQPPETDASSASPSKHPEPYAQLIYRALKSSPNYTMTLQEIYQWFRQNTDKDKGDGKGWQNSIRHNLSMNAAFTKRERAQAPGPALEDAMSSSSKRSTEWVLEDWAINDGVQSTTRYRKGNSTRRQPGSSPHHLHSDLRRGPLRRSRVRHYSHAHRIAATPPLTLPQAPNLFQRSSVPSSFAQYHREDLSIPRTNMSSYVPMPELQPSLLAPDAAMAGMSLMMPESSSRVLASGSGTHYTIAGGDQGMADYVNALYPFGTGDITGIYASATEAEAQPLFASVQHSHGLCGFETPPSME